MTARRCSSEVAWPVVGVPAHGYVRQLCGSSSRRPALALVYLASSPGFVSIARLLAPASEALLPDSHASSSRAAVPRAGACAALGQFGDGVVSRDPGAGRSPANKGHGWPAGGAVRARANGAPATVATARKALAVGPASGQSPEAAATAPDDRFPLCPEGQQLPAAATVGDTQRRTGGGQTMVTSRRNVRIMSIMF